VVRSGYAAARITLERRSGGGQLFRVTLVDMLVVLH